MCSLTARIHEEFKPANQATQLVAVWGWLYKAWRLTWLIDHWKMKNNVNFEDYLPRASSYFAKYHRWFCSGLYRFCYPQFSKQMLPQSRIQTKSLIRTAENFIYRLPALTTIDHYIDYNSSSSLYSTTFPLILWLFT